MINVHALARLLALREPSFDSTSRVRTQGSRPAPAQLFWLSTHFLQTVRVLLSTIWGTRKEDEKESKRQERWKLFNMSLKASL
jgi:hypothetical protein